MIELQGLFASFFDSDLHFRLQKIISSHDLFHFFRQVNGLLQYLQTFSCRLSFVCKVNKRLACVNKELDDG
jgi:hypothetical protein